MVEITSESEQKERLEKIVSALMTIKGIERGGAERLAEMMMKLGFKDLEALRLATTEDLLKVKGIGPTTAERIVKGLEKLPSKFGDTVANDDVDEEMEIEDGSLEEDKETVEGASDEKSAGSIFDDIVKKTRHVMDVTLDKTKEVYEKTKTTVDSKIIKPVKPRIIPRSGEDDDGKVIIETEEHNPEKERAVEEFRGVDGVSEDAARRLYEKGYTGLKDLIKKTLKE